MTSSIHASFTTLVREAPPQKSAFCFNGALLTYADVERELAVESAAAAAYASALVTKMLEFIARENATPGTPIAAQIRIDTRPSLCAIEQYNAMPEEDIAWKTMSRSWTTKEMSASLQAREADALSFLSDLMRVCRDLIGRQADHSRSVPTPL